ncbi:MAG: methylmalonyl-CoA epimerase [Chloroflexi bacterium]|nr:methylmalonyl-CoA epimerase [Chloroflexota bacterium]
MDEAIHHIAIAVSDIDAALEFFQHGLGLSLAARKQVPEEGVEIAFLPAGNTELELLQPLDDTSTVAQFIERRGEGLHHICLVVKDLDATIIRMRAQGVRFLRQEPSRNAEGVRYTFIHPKSARGVLVELYEAQ